MVALRRHNFENAPLFSRREIKLVYRHHYKAFWWSFFIGQNKNQCNDEYGQTLATLVGQTVWYSLYPLISGPTFLLSHWCFSKVTVIDLKVVFLMTALDSRELHNFFSTAEMSIVLHAVNNSKINDSPEFSCCRSPGIGHYITRTTTSWFKDN